MINHVQDTADVRLETSRKVQRRQSSQGAENTKITIKWYGEFGVH